MCTKITVFYLNIHYLQRCGGRCFSAVYIKGINADHSGLTQSCFITLIYTSLHIIDLYCMFTSQG